VAHGHTLSIKEAVGQLEELVHATEISLQLSKYQLQRLRFDLQR
jgi:hypothetical protein